MFEALNTLSRKVVQNLISGKSVSFNGKQFSLLNEQERLMLSVMAKSLGELTELTGESQTDKFEELLSESKLPEFKGDENQTEPSARRWKLDALEAVSFRGLAPANEIWSHEFECESHLFYGPNGCGKTSLMGAIGWCLTGQIFRDDRSPEQPALVEVFTKDDRPKKAGTRSDGLTLLDQLGRTHSSTSNYYVKLRFCDTNDSSSFVWIRRDSSEGLEFSENDSTWTRIESLDEAGIDSLDAELRILMPARAPHIQFGNNPDLVKLFAKIVGLDDLASISGIAESLVRSMRTRATRLEKTLKEHTNGINGEIEKLKESMVGFDLEEPLLERVLGGGRTLLVIKDFADKCKDKIEKAHHQLLQDLGLVQLSIDSPEYADTKQKMANLPGQLQLAIELLGRPVEKIFLRSVGASFPDLERLDTKRERIAAFEANALRRLKERANWAIQESTIQRPKLMLFAATYYDQNEPTCPVCAQSLDQVTEVSAQLQALVPLSENSDLVKDIADLERELLSELDDIVTLEERKQSSFTFKDQLNLDWEHIKEQHLTGLLSPIGLDFDPELFSLSTSIHFEWQPIESSDHYSIAPKFEEQLASAKHFIEIARHYHANRDVVINALKELFSSEDRPDIVSILGVLKRGTKASNDSHTLNGVVSILRNLYKLQQHYDGTLARVGELKNRADQVAASKPLGELVRFETIELIKSVAPMTKSNFEALYQNSILEFDMLTTGHAANPDIKHEFNVYLRADTERVPVGPFTNAGRLRAIILSFIFALISRSKGTLGFLLLDDPALSLDDEHKARFVDRLVGPLLAEDQVFLATHYEKFFKFSEPVFNNAMRYQMPPRQTVQDQVAFTPGDLLKRLEAAFSTTPGSCKDHGINLRLWAERTLRTLSGYCPMPFYIFNNLPGTIEAYARITDPRIATEKRDKIVADLKSPAFTRIVNACAHDGECPTHSDIQDGLNLLTRCQRESVDPEIERLRDLYNHATVGRAVDSRPNVDLLPFDTRTAIRRLPIIGSAAAASGGSGITWVENEEYSIKPYYAVRVTSDVLAPIAKSGDVLLLDSEDITPNDSDLVAVQLDDGLRLVRRYWERDHVPYFESINPTVPNPPQIVQKGRCLIRKIVGVLFQENIRIPSRVAPNEWTEVGDARKLLVNLNGIRVSGSSLEPIARQGQIVLAYGDDVKNKLKNGDLVCIDAEEIEAVIKRCSIHKNQLVLSATNPTDFEDPIIIDRDDVRHAYRVAGVIFKT